MAFDVSKFLALTALIATATGAGCSSSGDEPNESGGSAGTSQSGSGNQAGSPDPGGAGSDGGGQGGNGNGNGTGGAAAGEGGAALGGNDVGGQGEGGEGGAKEPGECLGTPAEGGAAGAPAIDPSLEDLCMDFFDVTCEASAEDFAPSYKVCEGVRERGLPVVAMTVASCLKELNAVDTCDPVKTAACFTDLVGTACVAPDTEAPCTSIHANCDEVSVAKCQQYADLVSPEMYEAFSGCMDPGNEGWYDTFFEGTCTERLDNCAGVRL